MPVFPFQVWCHVPELQMLHLKILGCHSLFSPHFFGRLCDGDENFNLHFCCHFRKRVCLALFEIAEVTENKSLKAPWFLGDFFICVLRNCWILLVLNFFKPAFLSSLQPSYLLGDFYSRFACAGGFLSRSLIFWVSSDFCSECFSGIELLSWLLEVFTQSLRKGNPVKFTSGDVRGN